MKQLKKHLKLDILENGGLVNQYLKNKKEV